MPTPNRAMREEARRGLDWREEYNRGGTEVGVASARDIVNNRNLSIQTVKRMASYFARHEVDKQGEGWSPGEDGYPSAGRIAWAFWGGNAGRNWANAILEKEENQKAERSKQCMGYAWHRRRQWRHLHTQWRFNACWGGSVVCNE